MLLWRVTIVLTHEQIFQNMFIYPQKMEFIGKDNPDHVPRSHGKYSKKCDYFSPIEGVQI